MTLSSTLQSLALRALPDGGQRTARRNAWAAMSEDAARARARRDALAALAAAERHAQRAGRTAASPGEAVRARG